MVICWFRLLSWFRLLHRLVPCWLAQLHSLLVLLSWRQAWLLRHLVANCLARLRSLLVWKLMQPAEMDAPLLVWSLLVAPAKVDAPLLAWLRSLLAWACLLLISR